MRFINELSVLLWYGGLNKRQQPLAVDNRQYFNDFQSGSRHVSFGKANTGTNCVGSNLKVSMDMIRTRPPRGP